VPQRDNTDNYARRKRAADRNDNDLREHSHRPGNSPLSEMIRPDRLPQLTGPSQESCKHSNDAAFSLRCIFGSLQRTTNRTLDYRDDRFGAKLIRVTK
jgi:hypothetical protein